MVASQKNDTVLAACRHNSFIKLLLKNLLEGYIIKNVWVIAPV